MTITLRATKGSALTHAEMDDNFEHLSALAGSFVVVTNPDYGATGDGSTDDTDAIQDAIDAVYTAGGGTVLFPEGTYLVTGLELKDKVILQGVSKRSCTIKLANTTNEHVIQAGTFDTYANGVSRDTPVGCASGGIRDLTIDGNKGNQTVAHHGIAYYGIDMMLDNVEVKNCEGWGIYAEAPGSAFSVVVGQNLQYTWRAVEAHDNLLGNIFYNGQSDSNLFDIVCYECGGEDDEQTNFWVGSKATGIRVVGLHCWGTSEYGLVVDGELADFSSCHVESAKTYKVWAKKAIIWTGGRIYEVGSNNSAIGFRLDNDLNRIVGCTATEIRGGLVDVSAGGSAGAYSSVEIAGYTGAGGSTLSVGTLPSTSEFKISLFGSTTNSKHQRNIGFDMNSGGLDRTNFVCGAGWASYTVSSNTLSISTMYGVLSEASPVTVNDITWTPGTTGIPMITFRNSGANAVTFAHNTSKLRNISGANISVGQHQSISYVHVTGAVWQHVGGKAS